MLSCELKYAEECSSDWETNNVEFPPDKFFRWTTNTLPVRDYRCQRYKERIVMNKDLFMYVIYIEQINIFEI